MAGKNQHGSMDMYKLDYSVDPSNPFALQSSDQVEALIRKVAKQMLPEGKSPLRSERYLSEDGARHTNYYLPPNIAQTVKLAVDERLSGLRQASKQSNIGMSLSSPVFTPFKTTTATISDAKVKAEVRRLLDASGGYLSDNRDGTSTFGVDAALSLPGKSGKMHNVSRSVNAKIHASNAARKAGYEKLMADAGYPGETYDGLGEEARKKKEKQARAKIAKRERESMTPEEEKEDVYRRLAKRGRRKALADAYAKENPDDPVVAERNAKLKAVADKKKSAKVKGGARFTAALIAHAIVAVITGISVVATVLHKIRETAIEIGQNVRKQVMTDARYNFAGDTTKNFERMAAQMGLRAGLLEESAGGMMAKWSSPTLYSDSNFKSLAPLLKGKTELLTRMASAGGDDNVLGMLDTYIDTVARSTVNRDTSVGKASSIGSAFARNAVIVSNDNKAVGELFEAYMHDFIRSGASSIDDWKQDGMQMSFHNWRTQYAAKGNKYATAIGTGLSNSTSQLNAESGKERVASLEGALGGLKTDVFQSILGNTQQLVEDFRTLLVSWVGRFFPVFAMKEHERTVALNTEAEKLTGRLLPEQKKEAEAVLKKYGLGSIENAADVYKTLVSKNPAMFKKYGVGTINNLQDDTDAVRAIGMYLDTLAAAGNLAKSRENNYDRTIVFDAATNAAAGQRAIQDVFYSTKQAARKEMHGDAQGYTTDVGMFAFEDEKAFNKGIAANRKVYDQYKSAVNSNNNSLSSMARSQVATALFNMAVANALRPDREEQAAEVRKEYLGFLRDEHIRQYGASNKKHPMPSDDKLLSRLDAEIARLRGFALAANDSFEQQGAAYDVSNFLTPVFENMSQIYGSVPRDVIDGTKNSMLKYINIVHDSESGAQSGANNMARVDLVIEVTGPDGKKTLKTIQNVQRLRNAVVTSDVKLNAEGAVSATSQYAELAEKQYRDAQR